MTRRSAMAAAVEDATGLLQPARPLETSAAALAETVSLVRHLLSRYGES